METKKLELGRVKFDGCLIISDPCYEPGSFCQIEENCLPGWYSCSVEVADIPVWGKRITKITAIYEGYKFCTDRLDYELCKSGRVAVDSGQMGIFDAKYYLNNQDNDYDNPESWYRKVCDITLADDQAGLVDTRGCVSSSGYGDGGYYAYHWLDRDTAVGFEVIFIEDDDDDSEDE